MAPIPTWTSHLAPRTSYLLPRTSHLLPRTSHLLPRTSYLVLNDSSTPSGRFRAYFVVSAADMPDTLPISVDGAITTGIDAVVFTSADKVYTIGGLYVGHAFELSSKRSQGLLPAGIYVIGNRKMVVK
ncbi:MAG: hypothetical protein IJT53_05450 [Prevotella sp.]|nr:hypothetical protein [Prevotella sp.]